MLASSCIVNATSPPTYSQRSPHECAPLSVLALVLLPRHLPVKLATKQSTTALLVTSLVSDVSTLWRQWFCVCVSHFQAVPMQLNMDQRRFLFFYVLFFCLVLREWSHPTLSITVKSPRIKFRLQQLRVCSNVMFTFELIAAMEDKCDVIQTVYASSAFYVPVCARVSQFRIWFVLSGDAMWRHQPDVMSSESFIFVLLLHRC